MAAFSKTAEAVIKVKADTAQASQGIGKVTKVVAGMAAGLFAAKKAFDVLSSAADDYAKRSQLMAAVGSASFKQVQHAAKDLITEQKALEVSAALMNGAFKVSQKDMNTAAKAMVALRNQGNDFNAVIDNVTRALVEGNGRALRQFGVNVDGSTGKVETFNAVMAALNDLAEGQHAKMDVAGDSMLRAGVKYQDAVDKFNLALGRMATALTPIVTKFAEIAALMASIVDQLPTGTVSTIGSTAFKGAKMVVLGIPGFVASELFGGEDGDVGQIRARGAQVRRGILGPSSLGRAGGALSGLGSTIMESVEAGANAAAEQLRIRGQRGSGSFDPQRFATRGLRSGTVIGGAGRVAPVGGIDNIGGFAGSFSAGGQTFTSAIDLVGRNEFGRIEGVNVDGLGGAAVRQLGQDVPSNLTKIKEAMAQIEPVANTFAAAGASAFNAWIQGSQSAGEAIKKFIGGALTSIATQMAGEAIKHGAMAIGSLAIGNLKGAGLHGKAAAMHAAGALSVGAMAKAMGGGGSAGRARGGLPGAAAGAFGGGGAAGSSTTVIVAPHPLEHNPRETTRRMRRALAVSESQNAGTGTVTM